MIWTIGNVILTMILERLRTSSSDVDISPGPPIWAFPLLLHLPSLWAISATAGLRSHLCMLTKRQVTCSPFILSLISGLEMSLTSEMSPWHFKLKTVKNPTHYLSHLFFGIILLLFLFFSPQVILSVITSGNLRTIISSA